MKRKNNNPNRNKIIEDLLKNYFQNINSANKYSPNSDVTLSYTWDISRSEECGRKVGAFCNKHFVIIMVMATIVMCFITFKTWATLPLIDKIMNCFILSCLPIVVFLKFSNGKNKCQITNNRASVFDKQKSVIPKCAIDFWCAILILAISVILYFLILYILNFILAAFIHSELSDELKLLSYFVSLIIVLIIITSPVLLNFMNGFLQAIGIKAVKKNVGFLCNVMVILFYIYFTFNYVSININQLCGANNNYFILMLIAVIVNPAFSVFFSLTSSHNN